MLPNHLMCVEELSKFLGVANSWIYDRTRVNSPDPIPHMKLGKYIRFDPDRVAEWLRRRWNGGSADRESPPKD